MDRMFTRSRLVFRLLLLVTFCGCSAVWIAPSQAADPLLRAEVKPLALQPRTSAPAFIDVTLRSRHPSIVEGILEIRIQSESQVLLRQQTRELALHPGAVTQRLLLPPVNKLQADGLTAELIFITPRGKEHLGSFPLSGEVAVARQYLIGVCGRTSSGAPDRLRLWQALRPEWIAPEVSNVMRQVTSLPVWLTPEDVPSALGLCAFDALVLEGVSFAALEEKQLSDIATWVRAGGSLCVAPKAPLGSAHVAFLNSLAELPGKPPAIAVEAGGEMSLRDGSLLMHRAGLGRMVITLAPPDTEADLAIPSWRRAIQFLVRARVAYPGRDGSTPNSPAKPVTRSYEASRVALASSALYSSLPRTSRMIPLPVITGLLGTFVLLVGPGEWLLLGRLRRRRWTWFTFPLLAIGFAGAAIAIANHYLGRGDRKATILVADVGDGQRTLRENRLDLRIAGRATTTVSAIHHGISVTCADQASWSRNEPNVAPLFQGSVPGQYALEIPLRQWRPVLQRTMSFSGGAELPNLDWSPIDAQLTNPPGSRPNRRLVDALNAQGWNAQVVHLGQLITPKQEEVRADFLTWISQFRETEGATWAAGYSPSGRDDLADLALHDPTDPSEWLVVAMKSVGQTLYIVRRLYHFDE